MSRLRPIGHEDRLSLVEHLDELRNRLIVSLVVLGVAFAVCYWQNDWLLTTINKPLQSTRNTQRRPPASAARSRTRRSTA